MPIYRGSQKVTPHRAGVDLARVYRGDQLVWQASPALALDWVLPLTTVTGYDFPQQTVFVEPPGPGSRYIATGEWNYTNTYMNITVTYDVPTPDGKTRVDRVFGWTTITSGATFTSTIDLYPGCGVSFSTYVGGPGSSNISGWLTLERIGDAGS